MTVNHVITMRFDKANPAAAKLFNQIANAQAAPNVRVGGEYEPRRKNQYSKPYTALVVENGYVTFHRGNPEKVDSMTVAKFIETVKL